jgi:integrase
MPRRIPKGCVEDRDRHGNIRVYYRAKGRPKVRLHNTPWTPAFMAEYDAAKNQTAPPIKLKGIIRGTWRWLCVKYFSECVEYKQLDPRTQRVRRSILESTFDEPIAPGAPKFFRDFPLSEMCADPIEVLRDRKLATPDAANSRVKAIRAVFKWAVRKKGPDGAALVSHNPARDIPNLKSKNPSGSHTWTLEEVCKFEERHPIGSKARLAMALLLFTGQRRSDAVHFGRQHVRNGEITFTQHKGRHSKPKTLTLPILAALQRILDASPCGELNFLVTEQGKSFTGAGFGNWFRHRCIEAGVPGRAHRLRKAGATIAADNGATPHELMAIFGWNTLIMAERYTRGADQKRLARSAMHRLIPPEQRGTKSSPTGDASGTFLPKTAIESKGDIR